MAIEWWKQIEARDREAAEASNRYVEQMKALQRERQERENRERVAAWEASQAQERAEVKRAAEANEQIRREMAERHARGDRLLGPPNLSWPSAGVATTVKGKKILYPGQVARRYRGPFGNLWHSWGSPDIVSP
jgi:hypothetical protein